MRRLLFLAALLLAAPLSAATYYFAPPPTGNDANLGTVGSPWQHFSKVFFGSSHGLLVAGDTVVLEDGQYTWTNNGQFQANCSTNAANGTALAPITIMAQNERQAEVHSDGTGSGTTSQAGRIINCSNWVVQGILWTSVPAQANSNSFSVLQFETDDHFTVRRNIVAHGNHNQGSPPVGGQKHGMGFYSSSNFLVEENEAWDIEAHAFFFNLNSAQMEVRRNYKNGVGGTGVDESFSSYPAKLMIYENNISEGGNQGFTINASGDTQGSTYYGNISISDRNACLKFDARGNDLLHMPNGPIVNDFLCVNTLGGSGMGIWLDAVKNVVFNHASIFINHSATSGFAHRISSSSAEGDCASVASLNNSFIKRTASTGGSGTLIEDPENLGCTVTTVVNTSWSKGMGTAWSPNTSVVDNTTYTSVLPTVNGGAETDPMAGVTGPCPWCPTGAACSGQGVNGTDIGATIEQVTEGGILQTGKPSFWDPATNQVRSIYVGAIVTGLNDGATTLSNVGTRLNVGINGCTYKGVLAATPTPSPTATITPTFTPTPTQTAPQATSTPTRTVTQTPTATPTVALCDQAARRPGPHGEKTYVKIPCSQVTPNIRRRLEPPQ